MAYIAAIYAQDDIEISCCKRQQELALAVKYTHTVRNALSKLGSKLPDGFLLCGVLYYYSVLNMLRLSSRDHMTSGMENFPPYHCSV